MQINPVSINKYNKIVPVKFGALNIKPAKPSLTQKYGININDVEVVSDKNKQISDEEKAVLVEKIIEAYELAKKNYNFGNIAKVGYATNIGLTNGNWHLATNFNNTRNEISSLCGERAAVIGAYNELLKSQSLKDSQTKPLNFKVKFLAMSSDKGIGTDKNAASPCAECLSWFNTTRFFDDDTTIAHLEKDDETGKYYLHLNTIGQYLPYRNELCTVLDRPCEELDVKMTQKALDSVKKKGYSKEDIKKLAKDTKRLYNNNKLADISGHNIAASVIANGKKYTASKIDFSKRWFTEPALFAAYKAIEEFGEDTDIQCICYAGNNLSTDSYGTIHNDGVVSIKTLGLLNTKFAKPDTLVITTDNDSINVRTISDYMPGKYKFKQLYNIK